MSLPYSRPPGEPFNPPCFRTQALERIERYFEDCKSQMNNRLEQGSQTRGPRAARAFCAARDAFWEFSNNQHLRFQVPWEKMPRNNWIKPGRCGFRPGRSNTDHISLSSKILRNLGSMLKTSSHALSTSGKYMARFLVKSFGECCGSKVLAAACYWPSSQCIPAQTLASVSGELNYDRSRLMLDSDKGVCCHRSFSKSTSEVLNLFAEGSQIQTYDFVGEPH